MRLLSTNISRLWVENTGQFGVVFSFLWIVCIILSEETGKTELWFRSSSNLERRKAMGELSHFDETGASRMVDVSGKSETLRTARASGRVAMNSLTLCRILERGMAKGDVLEVARLAGIMAAKRTGEWIPLCHPIGLDAVSISFRVLDEQTLAIDAQVKTLGRTGVEMEALTAVSAAALTIYDMCKSIDRGMEIGSIRLEEKTGGRSGTYQRDANVVMPLPLSSLEPDPAYPRTSLPGTGA